MDHVPVSEAITTIEEATSRLRTTLGSMPDDAYAEPSVLPDWTRAHVLAHIALNALGMVRVFDGLATGTLTTLYDSNEARNGDIATWAALPPADLRARLEEALDLWGPAAASVPEAGWELPVERIPGVPMGPGPARFLLVARRQEVEIHHADLGLAFGAAGWPADFSTGLLDRAVVERAEGPAFTATADDLGRSWSIGAGDVRPIVSGAAGDLAFWLVGRRDGANLACDAEALPTIGSWR